VVACPGGPPPSAPAPPAPRASVTTHAPGDPAHGEVAPPGGPPPGAPVPPAPRAPSDTATWWLASPPPRAPAHPDAPPPPAPLDPAIRWNLLDHLHYCSALVVHIVQHVLIILFSIFILFSSWFNCLALFILNECYSTLLHHQDKQII
jgi:hypothetical protein